MKNPDGTAQIILTLNKKQNFAVTLFAADRCITKAKALLDILDSFIEYNSDQLDDIKKLKIQEEKKLW